MTPTFLSVVVTTHNRADGVRAAVESIERHGPADGLEVIVVDDGSEPEHAAALEQLNGARVRVLRQADAGLGAARALGFTVATGEWFAVLDDDDVWIDGWAELVEAMRADQDQRLGIVSGAAQLVRPDGAVWRVDPPVAHGPLLCGATVQYLAGCWAMRRDVYLRSGGYLPGLSASHQTELFIRATQVCAELRLEVDCTKVPVARIERRDDTDRSLSNPRPLLDGVRWVLARHAARFDEDRHERSNWQAVAALNAFRLGEPEARTFAVGAVRDRPTNIRAWLRLGAVLAGSIGRRRWQSATAFTSPSASQRAPLATAVGLRASPSASLCTSSDLFFLPWRYVDNPVRSNDRDGAAFWDQPGDNDARYQDPVYRWAARLVTAGRSRVLDVGCGSGDKLVRRVGDRADEWLGVDQESGIAAARQRWGAHPANGRWLAADLSLDDTWQDLCSFGADLVICADVIEHLDDPVELLQRLRGAVRPGGRVLLSTPDRSRLEGRDPIGPPLNPRHVREWAAPELRLLVDAAGFEVLRVRHLLPRSYSPSRTELRRTAWRALHRMALPDRRSCMAFLLTPADLVPTE